MKTLKAGRTGLLTAVIAYFVLWFIMFTWLTGAEYSLLGDYFRWSWTGGGEIVTFIQLLSFFPAILIGLGVGLYCGLKKTKNK